MDRATARAMGLIFAGLGVVSLLLQLPGFFEDVAIGQGLIGLLPNLAGMVGATGIIVAGVLISRQKSKSL